jgi:hypothetical protein
MKSILLLRRWTTVAQVTLHVKRMDAGIIIYLIT